MVQIYFTKILIVYVMGYTIGQLLVTTITDLPAKKETVYILAVAMTMNAIIESI